MLVRCLKTLYSYILSDRDMKYRVQTLKKKTKNFFKKVVDFGNERAYN